MKGILKIELPDNFEKGDCHLCPISPDGYCPIVLNAYSCPLEIQENLPLVIIKDNKCVDLDVIAWKPIEPYTGDKE